MNAISQSDPQGTSNICRVGYALNAKKLRKGEDSDKEKSKSVHSLSDLFLGKSSGPACKKRTETSIWRGGGLADIISDGEAIEGVQFIPWDYEVPIHQQVIYFLFDVHYFIVSLSIFFSPSHERDLIDDLMSESQPTFHVIIHKLTEEIDRKGPSEKIFALQEYLRLHPATVIVDSFDAVHVVTNRARSCEALGRIIQRRYLWFARPNTNITTDRLSVSCFSQPKFVVVQPEDHAMGPDQIMRMMNEAGFSFPVICKPVEACGTPNSHSMAVVVSAAGLDLVSPPCIVQEYRDHDEIFFKVYVMGDEVMVFRRPSLPNLDSLAQKQRNSNREANVSLRDRSQRIVSPMVSHHNGCSSDESKPENGGHISSHEHSIINPVGCSERYLGLRSVAFDSRFAYPTACDFIDPNFNASTVVTQTLGGHQDIMNDAGSTGSNIVTDVIAVDNVADGFCAFSSGVTSNAVPASSSRTQSPLSFAVPVPSSGSGSRHTSTTVSPTMTMTMTMPPLPGDSNNIINNNRSSSAVRRTSSILSSEGRARKPSGKDLLHPLPTASMATAFSSSTASTDAANATGACGILLANVTADQSSPSAEEKAPLNGCNGGGGGIASRSNSTITTRCCHCHEADRAKGNGTKCLCAADKGKDNIIVSAAAVRDQHQNSFDFALSAGNIGNLSQG